MEVRTHADNDAASSTSAEVDDRPSVRLSRRQGSFGLPPGLQHPSAPHTIPQQDALYEARQLHKESTTTFTSDVSDSPTTEQIENSRHTNQTTNNQINANSVGLSEEAGKAEERSLENDSHHRRDSQDQPQDRGSHLLTNESQESDQLELSRRHLTKDTFSFLISANSFSLPVFSSIVIFGIQVTIFTLVAIDIIDLENTGNVLNIPENVESPVRVTEFLALIIAALTQDDIRTSTNLLRDGYDSSYFEEFEGATRTKWSLSIILRGLEGILGLYVTFLLVMQSETVLDLLLNFSAMEFVSLLDEAGFILIKQGFMGSLMRKEAKMLSRTYYDVPNDKYSAVTSVAFLLLLAGAMLGAWGVIFSRQVQGDFICNRIFVQFDDGFAPSLGAFSGIYNANKDLVFEGRVAYESRMGDGAIVGYCSEEGAWTLAILSNQDDGREADPCEWVAKSSESSSFDVASTSSLLWFVKTTESRIVPMESYQVRCYDCENNNDFCGERGVCENNECVCNDDRYGLRCEFQTPCTSLAVDERYLGFVDSRAFAREYVRLGGVQVYNRPVYTSPISPEGVNNDDGIIDIILFTGNRWVLTSTSALQSFDATPRITTDFESYLATFHAFYSDYGVSFISDAVHIDSTTDILASPIGLVWFHTATSDGGPFVTTKGIPSPDTSRVQVEPNLFCVVCDQLQNPCFFDAICQDDGTCQCTQGSSGRLCQIPPSANGRCDKFFNRAEFEFDGGDCCESTCRSTPRFTCGKDETGFVDIAYPDCKEDPRDTWLPIGLSIPALTSSSQSGMSVALGGRDGSILAVADPGANSVRLFDQVGSEWIQRGQTIEGPPNSNFGLSISLSGESLTAVKNPFTSPIITLAVVGFDVATIYDCGTLGCIQAGDRLTGTFGRSIDISRDGNTVVIGGEPLSKFEYQGSVKVYRRRTRGGGWTQQGALSEPGSFFRSITPFTNNGFYVSISGDGTIVAVGSLRGSVEPSGPSFQNMALLVQTYRWSNSQWVVLGTGIPGDSFVTHFLNDSSRGAVPLRSVVLSDDGLALAIGRKESVVVYRWDEQVTDWVPRGRPILSDNVEGLSGWSVDLNGDGSVLVIGTGEDSRTRETENHIRAFKWNGVGYAPLFNALSGGSTSAVSLSNEGQALAVGLPFSSFDGNVGGATTVYKYLPPPKCDGNSKFLRLSLTTDRKPQETYWTLHISTGEMISSPSYRNQEFSTYVEEACMPIDGWATFIIYDVAGDGMEVPGGYELFVDGELFEAGGSFEFAEKIQIGIRVCPEGMALLSVDARTNLFKVIWEVVDASGRDIVSRSLDCQASEEQFGENAYCTNIVEECIPADCVAVSIADHNVLAMPASTEDGCNMVPQGEIFYNVSLEGFDSSLSYSTTSVLDGFFCGNSIRFGECPPVPTIECETGTVPTQIEISRLGSLANATWSIAATCFTDTRNGSYPGTLLGELAMLPVQVVEQTCLPEGGCYVFDGYAADYASNPFFDEVKYSLYYGGVQVDIPFITQTDTATNVIVPLLDNCTCT